MKYLLLEHKSAAWLYEGYMELVMCLELSLTHIKDLRVKCFRPSLQIQSLMRTDTVFVDKKREEEECFFFDSK